MKTIYFDFFNVLSTPAYTPVVTKYIPENERPTWSRKIDLVDLGELPEHVFIGELAQRAGVADHQISREIDAGIELNHALIEYIQNELKPTYKIGLLTNAARGLIEHIFNKHLDIFDVVVISSDYNVIKPDPHIYSIAIKEAGAQPADIIFIDDNSRNIEAAIEAGMRGIVYTGITQFKNDLQKHLK